MGGWDASQREQRCHRIWRGERTRFFKHEAPCPDFNAHYTPGFLKDPALSLAILPIDNESRRTPLIECGSIELLDEPSPIDDANTRRQTIDFRKNMARHKHSCFLLT